MSRNGRLLLALSLSLTAWMPMLGVLSSAHYYVNNIEVPPPVVVVMALTMLATAVTVLTWVWFVRSLSEPKLKRKRGQLEFNEAVEAHEPGLIYDGRLADAWNRLADTPKKHDTAVDDTPAYEPLAHH